MPRRHAGLVSDHSAKSSIQRVCPGCEQELQRQPEAEGEFVQKNDGAGWASQVTPTIESRIHALNGGGRRLSKTEHAFFEPRLGADFSQVRVHTNSTASQLARSINARAFTINNHVVMDSSEFSPDGNQGKRLLAHELVHTIQQGAAPVCRMDSRNSRFRNELFSLQQVENSPLSSSSLISRQDAGTDEPEKQSNGGNEKQADQGTNEFGGLCICVFKGRTGKLKIDCGYRGNFSIWVIPEDSSMPAFTPVTCGVNYEADGFQIGGQGWKIDGSTCVTISCDGQSFRPSTCVNFIALALGKGPTRPVPAGKFANEPPAGSQALPVQ